MVGLKKKKRRLNTLHSKRALKAQRIKEWLIEEKNLIPMVKYYARGMVNVELFTNTDKPRFQLRSRKTSEYLALLYLKKKVSSDAFTLHTWIEGE